MAAIQVALAALAMAGPPLSVVAPLALSEEDTATLAAPTLMLQPAGAEGQLELIHVRARISLANSTRPGAQDALVAGCEPPPRGLSVLGFAVGSINEEYVRISDSVGCHCPFEACDVGRISFDRPLRLPHEPGEEISVMPDSLQVPSGRLTAEPPRDEHHTRAMVAAMRAHDWVTGLARVVSEGPDKWALRQLLCVLALILMGACVIGTLLLCCSKAAAGGKGELATG